MKILITAALPYELNIIKSWIKSAWLKINLDIDYLCVGTWNYESIAVLEEYLTKNPHPTFIRNIGVCWYWNHEGKKLIEPIQAASIINIHSGKERIIPPYLKIAPLRNCFSSETVVFSKPNFEKEILTVNNEMYFDMESRWISFAAERHRMPYIILKVPFDFIGKETSMSIEKWKEWILSYLGNLQYRDYLEKIVVRIDQQGKSE